MSCPEAEFDRWANSLEQRMMTPKPQNPIYMKLIISLK